MPHKDGENGEEEEFTKARLELREFLRSSCERAYGRGLYTLAQEKQNIYNFLETGDPRLQQFALDYMSSLEFHDDRYFVDFCTNCLDVGHDLGLKLSSVKYLAHYGSMNQDPSVMLSLVNVLRVIMRRIRANSNMVPDDRSLALFINYALLLHLNGPLEDEVATPAIDIDDLSEDYIDSIRDRVIGLGDADI